MKLPELVGWLEEHASKRERYIDYQEKTIRDTWGNNIVVISRDGKFLGVGSPGPDRTWQDGDGDDIVVMLDDVRNSK